MKAATLNAFQPLRDEPFLHTLSGFLVCIRFETKNSVGR